MDHEGSLGSIANFNCCALDGPRSHIPSGEYMRILNPQAIVGDQMLCLREGEQSLQKMGIGGQSERNEYAVCGELRIFAGSNLFYFKAGNIFLSHDGFNHASGNMDNILSC